MVSYQQSNYAKTHSYVQNGITVLPLLVTILKRCRPRLSQNLWFAALTICLSSSTYSLAQSSEGLSSEQLEQIKTSAIKLNRDLLILEEELLYPASNQIGVFVAMDVGHFFQLDSVKVSLNDQLLASHLYTERQIQALYKGGIQRLYMGSVKSGTHRITAVFTGQGPNGRDYKRAAEISFEKTDEPVLLELSIDDSTARHQPEFIIKRWQTD